MLLKSIEYKNFRPFKGVQSIDFCRTSENPNGNVFVILGNNTYGKSTIVLSFIWCFYGISKFSREKEILNREVEDSLASGEQAEAHVKVIFEDEGKEYTIRRTQKFMKSDTFIRAYSSEMMMSYVDEGGQTKSCGKSDSEYEKVIRAMLPEELSSFFFFEGEKNNDISKKDLGTAVKNLLGLEAMSKMKEHLRGNNRASVSTNSVMGQYEAQMGKATTKINEQSLLSKKEEAEKRIKEIDERVNIINIDIDNYDNTIEGIKDILRKAEPTTNIQIKIDRLDKLIKGEEENLKKERKQFITFFNDFALDLMAYPFYRKAKDKLNSMDLEDKGIKGIEITAIKELLQRGKCLCGTELNEGSVAYRKVESYYDILPPKSVGTLVREMQDKIVAMEENAISFLNEFESKYQNIMSIIERIDGYSREYEACEDELSKIEQINATQYKSDLNLYKKRKQEHENEKLDLTKEKGGLEKDIDNCDNEYKKILASKDKNDQAYRAYCYAESLYEWVSKTYDKKESEMRERLEKIVTEKFNKIYSGHREVKINSNYNIEISVNGQALDDTGGLRVIQYFAYVGGLVQLASEVMAERNEDEKFGEDYPLVLDAAFSHADEGHVEAISKELAASTKQLVLAVMPKDWNYAKQSMQRNIARIYQLRKINETSVVIEEVK